MIAAVILCAGSSRRMGQPKALLPLENEPLLARVVKTARAAEVAEIVVAVGPPHGTLIRETLHELDVKWAWNAQPERGMLTSVQAALPLLPAAASGTLIWPVDIPFVRVETVRALLLADRTQLAVPTHEGRGGHPLWLPRALFAETAALRENESLRTLRERHLVQRIASADPGVLCDLDTPADYERAVLELGLGRAFSIR